MATHIVCLNHLGCSIWPLYIRRGASAEEYELMALKRILGWLRVRHGKRVKRLRISECMFPPPDLKKSYPALIREAYGYAGREVVLAYMAIFYALNLSRGRTEGVAVVTGSLDDDLFVHNSPIFWEQFKTLINIELGPHSIQLVNPLQSGYDISPANKSKVIKFAKEQGFPLRTARSCVAATPSPCGECMECVQRNLAEGR